MPPTPSFPKPSTVFDEFGIDAQVTGSRSPTVTRYEVELGAAVKVEKVTALSKNIAYAVASRRAYPVADLGKSAIGIEIPKPGQGGRLLATRCALRRLARSQPLVVSLGKDVEGGFMHNVAKMPHICWSLVPLVPVNRVSLIPHYSVMMRYSLTRCG